jgi:hypothetical protein
MPEKEIHREVTKKRKLVRQRRSRASGSPAGADLDDVGRITAQLISASSTLLRLPALLYFVFFVSSW